MVVPRSLRDSLRCVARHRLTRPSRTASSGWHAGLPRRRVRIRPTSQFRRKSLYNTQPLVAASENPLRATTINDFVKLGTALGGTPTIVERLTKECQDVARRLRKRLVVMATDLGTI